jgi:hypothetical protein
VVEDDQVPPRSELATAGLSDDAQDRHGLDHVRRDATADVADHGGLTEREAEHVNRVHARVQRRR